jgi:hypothetical protein
MDSPRLFFQSTEIVDFLRCIARSTNQRPCERLHQTEYMASAQFDTLAFRLFGRGVF